MFENERSIVSTNAVPQHSQAAKLLNLRSHDVHISSDPCSPLHSDAVTLHSAADVEGHVGHVSYSVFFRLLFINDRMINFIL